MSSPNFITITIQHRTKKLKSTQLYIVTVYQNYSIKLLYSQAFDSCTSLSTSVYGVETKRSIVAKTFIRCRHNPCSLKDYIIIVTFADETATILKSAQPMRAVTVSGHVCKQRVPLKSTQPMRAVTWSIPGTAKTA